MRAVTNPRTPGVSDASASVFSRASSYASPPASNKSETCATGRESEPRYPVANRRRPGEAFPPGRALRDSQEAGRHTSLRPEVGRAERTAFKTTFCRTSTRAVPRSWQSALSKRFDGEARSSSSGEAPPPPSGPSGRESTPRYMTSCLEQICGRRPPVTRAGGASVRRGGLGGRGRRASRLHLKRLLPLRVARERDRICTSHLAPAHRHHPRHLVGGLRHTRPASADTACVDRGVRAPQRRCARRGADLALV